MNAESTDTMFDRNLHFAAIRGRDLLTASSLHVSVWLTGSLLLRERSAKTGTSRAWEKPPLIGNVPVFPKACNLDFTWGIPFFFHGFRKCKFVVRPKGPEDDERTLTFSTKGSKFGKKITSVLQSLPGEEPWLASLEKWKENSLTGWRRRLVTAVQSTWAEKVSAPVPLAFCQVVLSLNYKNTDIPDRCSCKEHCSKLKEEIKICQTTVHIRKPAEERSTWAFQQRVIIHEDIAARSCDSSLKTPCVLTGDSGGRFCVQLCKETLSKRATSVAHFDQLFLWFFK